jgi:rsbT co-antagonist protein RsbR
MESVKVLKKKKAAVLDVWMKNQLEDNGFRDDLMGSEDLKVQSQELLNALLDSLTDANIDRPQSDDFREVIEILSSVSISRAKQGYSPRETASFIFKLKDALFSAMKGEIKDVAVLYDETLKIGRLLDDFSMATFETFIKGREEMILRQTDEISEISTPVIRVWDGVLALPIIGTLDSSRTQIVMENLLQEIVETGSSIAILDISGVPAVDSLVAQHLIKTVSATRLMGAECIISGIRPEIAQTIVHLGIDLSNIITKATLASALKTAFSMLRYEVVKKAK